MKEQLRKYICKRFRRYPKTKEILELREELYSMMCDKFDDCVAQGGSEKESLRKACELMQDCKSAVREVASRAMLYETARFVDIYKQLTHISHDRSLEPEERSEMKFYNRLLL